MRAGIAAPGLKCSPDSPDAVRLAAIRKRPLIRYSRFNAIIDELQSAVENWSKRSRYKAIFASSHNGKTTLAEELVRRFPRDLNLLGDGAIVPAVYILMPGAPSIQGYAMALLDAIGEPYNRRSSGTSLLNTAHACLRAIGTRVLLIDEFQHLRDAHWREQLALKNTIKSASEACGLSVFVFGMPGAIDVIESDPQLSKRFEHIALPPWSYDADTLQLLLTLEQLYPLKKTSNVIGNQELVLEILSRTEGIFGHILDVMEDCAVTAVMTGREVIDMRTLNDIQWVPPSLRAERTLSILQARPEEILPPRAN